MPAQTKAFTAPLTLKDDATPGAVQACFSTFNVIDKQGDVVLPGAFTPGVPVPLIWAHEWETMPVGKGTIEVHADRAVFNGAFHLQTQYSRDAYETVKAMGDLQEYSYGFDVDDAEPGEWEGQPVRLIRKFGRIYEVSPVLVGAGERTGTLAIKSVEPVDGAKPFENEHACRLVDPGRFQPNSFRRMTRDHNGKEYSVIMGKLKGESAMTDQAFRYPKDAWTADAARAHCNSHDGASFEPASGKAACGCADADPLTTSLTLLRGVLDADTKAGRVLAERNWQRIQQAHGLLQAVMDDATGEPAATNDGKGRALWLAFQRISARQLGVPV
jgi:HK97 family phage prohead protease